MRQQRRHPLSPQEQRPLRIAIQATVFGMFAGLPCRPAPHRGYIDRAACGRTAPGLDVLAICILAIRAGLPREQIRALPLELLRLVDAQLPAEDTLSADAALLEEARAGAEADIAQTRAAIERTPEAWETAAERSDRHAEAARRCAASCRIAAHRARQSRTTPTQEGLAA